MRYVHGPGGLIGITLCPSALKRWSVSLHTCSRLLKNLDDMIDSTELLTVTTHKEEAAPRIDSNVVDRHNLREKLDSCIDRLMPEERSAGILNILSGRIGPDSINVDNTVSIGRTQHHAYDGQRVLMELCRKMLPRWQTVEKAFNLELALFMTQN